METKFPAYPIGHDIEAPDQDLAFGGVDMLSHPLNVAPGLASRAVNKRTVDQGATGVAGTRLGLFTPAWGRLFSPDFPARLPASIAAIADNCWAVSIFSDPADKLIWIVAAGNTGLYFFRETEIARFLPYPLGQTCSAPANLVQQYNNVFLYRSTTQPTLVWPGDWSAPIAQNAVVDPLGNPYAPMPNGSRGLAWQNRNWIIAGPDDAIASRIDDYTQYQSVNANNTIAADFFVNQGTGDELQTLVPMAQYSALFLKSKSLHVFSSEVGDLSDAALTEITRDINFGAPNTVVQLNGVVWWLDRRGVRSAVLTALNYIQLNPEPVSARIEPVIRRINWACVNLASAIIFNNRVYIAVPLDQETTPRHVLVYNLLTQAWETSWDEWDASLDFDIVGWAIVPWMGVERLFAVSSTMQLACYEYGLGEDFVYPNRAPIADALLSRGYSSGDRSRKKWTEAEIQLETWNPCVELAAVFDGANKSFPLAPPERNRTRFITVQDLFDPSNADGRSENPDREDYSVLGAQDPCGLRVDTVAAGVTVETFQSIPERRSLDERQSSFVQISVVNNRGACRVRYIGVSGQPGDRSELRTAA